MPTVAVISFLLDLLFTTGPILIAVFITEMVILFKHVIIIILRLVSVREKYMKTAIESYQKIILSYLISQGSAQRTIEIILKINFRDGNQRPVNQTKIRCDFVSCLKNKRRRNEFKEGLPECIFFIHKQETHGYDKIHTLTRKTTTKKNLLDGQKENFALRDQSGQFRAGMMGQEVSSHLRGYS